MIYYFYNSVSYLGESFGLSYLDWGKMVRVAQDGLVHMSGVQLEQLRCHPSGG